MFDDVSYWLCLHKLVSRVSFLLYIADVKTLSLSVFGYIYIIYLRETSICFIIIDCYFIYVYIIYTFIYTFVYQHLLLHKPGCHTRSQRVHISLQSFSASNAMRRCLGEEKSASEVPGKRFNLG